MTNHTEIDWENGTAIETEPALIEFNQYLKKLDINVVFTQFSDSNFMRIYVYSVGDVVNAKKIFNKSDAAIIDILFSIAGKHQKTLKYDRAKWINYSFTQILSFEIACINRLVRSCKPLFVKKMNTWWGIKPKYIFCHSEEDKEYSIMPGYRIVYESPKLLARIGESQKKKIADRCDEILRKHDKTGFYSRDKIAISYYDVITDSKSLYFLSRED